MELSRRLATALATVSTAVDRLEKAAERRSLADAEVSNLRNELAVMQEDRMRLAGELGRSLAHARALLGANGEVSERLDRVSDTVHRLVEQLPAGSPDDPAGTSQATR